MEAERIELRKIDATGSIERLGGIGHPRSARNENNIASVNELILSQEDMSQTHRTQRQIALEIGICQASVNLIVNRDLRLRCFKKRRAQDLIFATRLQRCRLLMKRFPASLVNFIWFTDEKLFTVSASSSSQNDLVYAASGTKRETFLPIDFSALDRRSACC